MEESLQFWEKQCSIDKFQSWCHKKPAPRWKEDIANRVIHGDYITVLDAGCGTGQLGELLQEKSKLLRTKSTSIKYVGLEITPKFVEFCNARGIRCVEGDIGKGIPFVDEEFDFIACLDVLNYGPDYQKRTAELVRVLRPGGLLAMSFFKPWCSPAVIQERNDGSGLIEHFINLQELTSFLKQEMGLRVEEVSCSGYNPNPKYLVCHK